MQFLLLFAFVSRAGPKPMCLAKLKRVRERNQKKQQQQQQQQEEEEEEQVWQGANDSAHCPDDT